MDELIKELWNAANTHSVIVGGEFLDHEYEGTGIPPKPSDEEVLKQVTAYLKNSV